MDKLNDIVLMAYPDVEPPESDVISVNLDGELGNFFEPVLMG